MSNPELAKLAASKAIQAQTKYDQARVAWKRKRNPKVQAAAYQKMVRAEEDLRTAMGVKSCAYKRAIQIESAKPHLSGKERVKARKAARRALDRARLESLASTFR